MVGGGRDIFSSNFIEKVGVNVITAAEKRNQARQRRALTNARKKELGLVRVEVWALPEHKEYIKKYAKELAQKDD